MKNIFISFIIFLGIVFASADPLKHENEGCPDNSNCGKITGLKRSKWLNILKTLNENKISEKKANEAITKETGIPINIWAPEEAYKNNNNYILWDSPCKQHKAPNPKYLIGEIFADSLTDKTQKSNPQIIFSNAIVKDEKGMRAIIVPRGDAPLSVINNSFYYTKDDEGSYYGLLLNFNGQLKISKSKRISKFPREIDCPKDMTEEFYRKAPTLNFYKGHLCKEIWNQDKNNYITILVGWSCN